MATRESVGGKSPRWILPVGVACGVSLLFAPLGLTGVVSGSSQEAIGPAPEATERGEVETVQVDTLPWAAHYPLSLHATAQGMKAWYAESNDGFEEITGVPYEELPCKSCHEPSATGGCASCYGTTEPRYGAEVDASLSGVCGGCHSRQQAEAAHFSDVHRDRGMDCLSCLTEEDVMGDGKTYSSMLADGVIDVTWWDHTSEALSHAEGVLPVPPDYRMALRFDFVDLDRPGGTIWSWLESGPERMQILFGEPLSEAQMEKLGWTALWRHSK